MQSEVDDISRANGARTTRSIATNTTAANMTRATFVTTKQLRDNALKKRKGGKKTGGILVYCLLLFPPTHKFRLLS